MSKQTAINIGIAEKDRKKISDGLARMLAIKDSSGTVSAKEMIKQLVTGQDRGAHRA